MPPTTAAALDDGAISKNVLANREGMTRA